MYIKKNEEAGAVHTSKDKKVSQIEIDKVEAEINGNVSLLIKFFRLGQGWNQVRRVRETMLTGSQAICPLYLTFKDHKGWSAESGKPPPTRPIAGGNVGLNLSLSEVISEVCEALVIHAEESKEVISTEDMIARIKELNERNKDWTEFGWWEGRESLDGGLVGCNKCKEEGDEKRGKLASKTGLRRGVARVEEDDGRGQDQDQGQADEEGDKLAGITGMLGEEEEYERCGCMNEVTEEEWTRESQFWTKEQVKVTAESLMKRRNKEGALLMMKLADSSSDGKVRSTEVPADMLQDMSRPIVIVGFDVEQLYPSLEMGTAAKIIEEMILKSKIRWTDLEYMEGARMVALNKSEDWIRKEGLSRIIPRRRKRQGTRPGPTGKDPRSRDIGSQEQWIFPDIVLTEDEKRRILAAVVRVAVEILFSTHLYTFGGEVFLQQKGGPIGLRATCCNSPRKSRSKAQSTRAGGGCYWRTFINLPFKHCKIYKHLHKKDSLETRSHLYLHPSTIRRR